MTAGHRVNWFGPPDRPVDGGTIFVRPAVEEPDEAQPEPGEKAGAVGECQARRGGA